MARTFSSFKAFGAELSKLAEGMSGAEKAKITKAMGRQAQVIAERAASADLGGDPKFSGWPPRLDTQLKTNGSGATTLMPTRHSAGPWTVAERGRNQGNARGFAGPGVNRRTGLTARTKNGGLRRVRTTTGRSNWNGYTRGKNTASEAFDRMEQELPKIAAVEVRRAIQKHVDVD